MCDLPWWSLFWGVFVIISTVQLWLCRDSDWTKKESSQNPAKFRSYLLFVTIPKVNIILQISLFGDSNGLINTPNFSQISGIRVAFGSSLLNTKHHFLISTIDGIWPKP